MSGNEWLDHIYRAYSKDIFRYAYSILKHPQRAEDVTQYTFLKAWQARTSAPKETEVKPWLFRIARNTAYDLLRKDGREYTVDSVPENTEGETTISARELLLLIDSLNRPDRDIVSLKVIAGLTHKEIAQVLRMSVHSVKKRYERSIHTLRLMYEEGM